MFTAKLPAKLGKTSFKNNLEISRAPRLYYRNRLVITENPREIFTHTFHFCSQPCYWDVII